MLNFHSGKWSIEISKDIMTGEIDAFVWDRIKGNGRYFIEDNLENDNDIEVPYSILNKAKEMLDNVTKVIG